MRHDGTDGVCGYTVALKHARKAFLHAIKSPMPDASEWHPAYHSESP
ncbi:hypothetical protein ACNKHP_02680 [Shigella boydii]